MEYRKVTYKSYKQVGQVYKLALSRVVNQGFMLDLDFHMYDLLTVIEFGLKTFMTGECDKLISSKADEVISLELMHKAPLFGPGWADAKDDVRAALVLDAVQFLLEELCNLPKISLSDRDRMMAYYLKCTVRWNEFEMANQ